MATYCWVIFRRLFLAQQRGDNVCHKGNELGRASVKERWLSPYEEMQHENKL